MGSAPAALCPPPLPELGSHQPSQPRWGQPGHRKATVPLKLNSGPLPMAFFAEAGSRDPYLHREPHSLPKPRAARLSQEPVSTQTLSQFPSKCHREAGNYSGSILDCQQHVLGAGRCVHVSLWPQEHAQHPFTEHSDLLIFLDSIFMEEHLSADTRAMSSPPLLTEVLLPSLLLRCCPPADGRTGRAGEGGVRA